jgi:hypothetical protein
MWKLGGSKWESRGSGFCVKLFTPSRWFYFHGDLITGFFWGKKVLDLLEHMREQDGQHVVDSDARTW